MISSDFPRFSNNFHKSKNSSIFCKQSGSRLDRNPQLETQISGPQPIGRQGETNQIFKPINLKFLRTKAIIPRKIGKN
jgi:hypothetical protein